MGEITQQPAALTLALRWLAHPVSVLALVVMAVNDHFLKAQFGSWVTGKLSDFAGLVFFPALVAAVLAAVARVLRIVPNPRTVALAAIAMAGVGFTWVKATAGGAAAASEVLSAVAGPSVVLHDPSDLLALTALGVATWVSLTMEREADAHHAAGPSRKASPRDRLRTALGVATFPLALLASAATSAGADPSASVVMRNDGSPLLFVSQSGDLGRMSWYQYGSGSWVEVLPSDLGLGDDGYEFGAPIPHQNEDCVPSNDSVCFRVIDGGTGVERSLDGGRTWRVDWQLTDDEVGTLEWAYSRPAESFETLGVGVFETASEYVVVAGNGVDGFAIRDQDGAWERVRFTFADCCSRLKNADLSVIRDLPPQPSLPSWLTMGFGFATLALPVTSWLVGRRKGVRVGAARKIWGGLAFVLGAQGGFLVMYLSASNGPLATHGAGSDSFTMFGGAAVAFAVCLTGAAVFGAFHARKVVWVAGAWVAGALGAGVLAPKMTQDLWLQFLAAAVAVLAPALTAGWLAGISRSKGTSKKAH